LRKQSIRLLAAWQNDNALEDMLSLAADDSLPLADHVLLMRGATRLLAAQNQRNRQEGMIILAMITCRRPDELSALVPLLSNARTEEGRAAYEAASSSLGE